MAGMCPIVPSGGIRAGYDPVPGSEFRHCNSVGGTGPVARAVPVTLTAAERKTLKKRARGTKTPFRDRLRAQIVLAAARGRDNARIAAELRTHVDTARKWRGRFAARRLAGLED